MAQPPTRLIHCHNCGATIEASKRFCTQCGSEQIEQHSSRRARLVAGLGVLVATACGVLVGLAAAGAFSSAKHTSSGSAPPRTPSSTTSPPAPRTTTRTTAATTPAATYGEGDFVAAPPAGWNIVEDGQSKGSYVESKWVDPAHPGDNVLVDATPGSNLPPDQAAAPVRASLQGQPGYVEVRFGPGDITQAPSQAWIFMISGNERVDWFFSSCGNGFAVLGSTTPARFRQLLPTFKTFADSVHGTCAG